MCSQTAAQLTFSVQATGWLEVEIVYPPEKEQLLHSKKNGQGYIDTDAKVSKILNGIGMAANN